MCDWPTGRFAGNRLSADVALQSGLVLAVLTALTVGVSLMV